MPTAPITTFKTAGLQPVYPHDARMQHVRLPASVSYLQAQVLGEVVGANEVQSLAIDATGGTFTASFGGIASAATAYNATAAVLQANLEAIPSIGTGNVAVTKGSTVWTLTHTPTTDGGTFAIEVTVGSVTRKTSLQPWDETAANMELDVEALDNVGAGNGTVSGSAGGPYTISFSPSLLLSGQISVRVVDDTTTDGGVFLGGVIVAALAQGTYLVEFVGDLGKRDVAALTTGAGSLTGGAGTATVAVVTAGSGLGNEITTLTDSGTVSGGTFTLTVTALGVAKTTADIAFDATTAAVQAALVALDNVGAGDVVVTGTASGPWVLSWQGALSGLDITVTADSTDITGGGSILVTTAVGGAAGTPGTMRAYDATGTDGRQVPRGLLAYDCSTDSSGNHSWAQTAGQGEHGVTRQGVPAFFAGDFRTEELVGLTDAAIAAAGWRLIAGSVAKGIVRLP